MNKGIQKVTMERFIRKKDFLLNEIRRKIVSGEYPHGEKLPSEPEFAAQLNVARGTLRKTLNVLEDEGLLVRISSKGTFVNYPAPQNRKKILVLLKDSAQEDISYQSHYELPAMQDAARELGLTLQVCSISFVANQKPEEAAASLKNSGEFLGAVIFDGLYTGKESYVKALQLSGLPVVMAGCQPGDCRTTGFAGVRTDTRKAWQDGLQTLMNDGHRRIAVFYDNWIPGSNLNIAEGIARLEALGIYSPELMCSCKLDYYEIQRELKRLMSLNTPPTAIMCRSDFYAIFAERAAKELNIAIPEELAIMGYSGIPGGTLLSPSLSTVDKHYDVIGHKAVELLARSDRWFGKNDVAVPELVIPHNVVIRQSTAIKRVEALFA